jgi:hypothetical protein
MAGLIFNKFVFEVGETAYVKITHLPQGFIKLMVVNEKNGVVVHEYQFLNLEADATFPYSFKITQEMLGDNIFYVQKIYLWWHENLATSSFVVIPPKEFKFDEEYKGDKTPTISTISTSAPFVFIILLLLLLIAIARRKK